jgi:hypothetical protein
MPIKCAPEPPSNPFSFRYMPSKDYTCQIGRILAINSINRSLYVLFPSLALIS